MTQAHAPHFFIERSSIREGRVVLEGGDARHLAVVRRAKAGDRISVSDGEGRLLDARIVEMSTAGVACEVVGETFLPAPRPAIAVMQGLARAAKIDLVVQKLVEIGVEEIAVFRAGRSVPRWGGRKAEEARARWSAVAREAAKQSRRARLPAIAGPLDLDEAVARVEEADVALVAHESAERRLRSALPDALEGRLALVVGPEGGLAPEEVSAFVAGGAVPVSLGDQILRTETAALVAASAVMYHFGRIG